MGELSFLSNSDYVSISIDMNIFFLRIMMEHSIFLEASFTPENKNLAMEAEGFKLLFEGLLSEQSITHVISLWKMENAG
jgi:hypothetical protein